MCLQNSSLFISALFCILLAASQAVKTPKKDDKTPALPKKIVVSTIEHQPFVIKDKISGNLSGFLVDIMNEVCATLEKKCKIVPKEDKFKFFTAEDEWKEVYDDVVSGNAHVGLASFSMKKKYMDVIEYSIPILHNGFALVRSSPHPVWRFRSTVFFCLSPLSTGVWVCVIVVLIVTVALLTANASQNPRERSQRVVRGELGPNVSEEPQTIKDHFTHSLWFILSTTALQSATRQPMSIAGRILSLAWWLFIGLTLCTYIVALLMDIVASTSYREPGFTTVKELMNSWANNNGYRVYFMQNHIRERFKASHNPMFMFLHSHAQPKSDPEDETKGKVGTLAWARTLLNESDRNLIVMGSESTQELMKSMDCGSVMATEFLDDRYLGLVFPRSDDNRPLRVAINKVLLSMSERGETRRLVKKWGLMGRGKCGLGFDLNNPLRSVRQVLLTESVSEAVQGVAEMFYNSIPIEMGNFSGILVLYIIGLVFAVCGVALDMYMYTHPEGFKHNEQILTATDARDEMVDTPEFQNLNEA